MRRAYVLGGVLVMVVLGAAACGSDDPAPIDPGPGPTDDAGPTEDAGRTDAGGGDAGHDGGGADATPDADPDPAARSGTRLRRRYLEAGPGAERTLDFWDTELETACTFATAADGELRCLPRERDHRVRYADSGCNLDPVIAEETGADSCGPMAFRSDPEGRVYRKGAPRVLARYYERGGTRCNERSGTTSWTFWTAEPVASAAFVRGTLEVEPRADGMTARYVAGEDGSRQLLAVRDTGRNATCLLDREAGRCVPSRIGIVGGFSDAACTLPVGQAAAAEPPDLLAASRRDAGGCRTGYDYFAVGPRLAADAPLYRRDGEGACVAATRLPNVAYYAQGGPISLPSLPATKIVREGTGPLRVHRHTDSAGAPLGVAHAFWDSDRDTECDPVLLPEGGGYRCVPKAREGLGSGKVSPIWFADAACGGTPLGEFPACSPSQSPYIMRDRYPCSRDGIRDVERIYERGPAHVGTHYEYTHSRDCEAREADPSYRFFLLGPVVAPSSLPKLELKTE